MSSESLPLWFWTAVGFERHARLPPSGLPHITHSQCTLIPILEVRGPKGGLGLPLEARAGCPEFVCVRFWIFPHLVFPFVIYETGEVPTSIMGSPGTRIDVGSTHSQCTLTLPVGGEGTQERSYSP